MERMACEHNSDARVDFGIDSCAVRFKQEFGPDLYRHLATRLMGRRFDDKECMILEKYDEWFKN